MAEQNLLKRSKLRNSRACEGSDNLGHYTNFDRDREDQGWDFAENVSMYGVSNGVYFLSADTESPSLSRSTTFASVDAALYTEVVLKFKYVTNRSDSEATVGKVQFTTSSDSTFNDDKSLEFSLVPGGGWNTYYLDFSRVRLWVGSVTNLKIIFTTNGKKDDEIFLSYIKIQRPQFTFCTDSCYQETSETVLGLNFDSQSLGFPPDSFAISNSSTTRVASIELDPQNSSNKVMRLARTLSGTTGPTVSRIFSSKILSGFLSMDFSVSSFNGTFKLEKDLLGGISCFRFGISSAGKMSYFNGVSFVDFSATHQLSLNTWHSLLITFDVDRATASVYLDDTLLGSDVSYNFLGPVEGVVIDNSGTAINTLLIDNLIAVSEDQQSTICPGIGRQSEVQGLPVVFNSLNVVSGVNDRLIVNINGYGDVAITLLPGSYDLSLLARELETELSRLDTGGYPYSEVIFIGGSFIIRSGTYGFDSSVTVKKYESSTLSEQLGFTDSLGNAVYSTVFGRPHSGTFKFTNTYKALTSSLNSVTRVNSTTLKILHNPLAPSVEIGASSSGKVSRRNSISGRNKTFIDFQHRASSEGYIEEVLFQGVLPGSPRVKATGSSGQVNLNEFNTGIPDLPALGVVDGDLLIIDEPGYSGNGTYQIAVQGRGGYVRLVGVTSLPTAINLSFYIHNIPKVKHFRPTSDGKLTLVNETALGLQTSGQLYTRTPDSHKIGVNWYVHRGDLIGIYNPIKVFTGNDPNKTPDTLYLEFEGDVVGAVTPVEVLGQGSAGIGLYARSKDLQKRGSYDLEFSDGQTVEYLDIKGRITSSKVFYNLCAAVGQGLSVTATVTGTHVHATTNNLGLLELISHNNVAYNVAALTDGVQQASNGFLGTFQSNVAGASYFYISGDGEFAGYEDSEGNSVQSLEFPFPGPNLHLNVEDYALDNFDITLSWAAKKEIERVIVYFKEYPNLDSFCFEYLENAPTISDGTLPNFTKIGLNGQIEYTGVKLDTLTVPRTPDSLNPFNRHYDKIFVGAVAANNAEDGPTVQQLRRVPFTVLEKTFETVQTTALNLHCFQHKSTKISEIEVYSSVEAGQELAGSLELYFSINDEDFQRAVGEQISEDTVRFYIRFPTKNMRLVVEPNSEMEISEILAVTSDDLIRYKKCDSNKPLSAVDVPIEKGAFSDPVCVEVHNGTGCYADLELSVDVDEASRAVVLKSSLNTLGDISLPEIGPPGVIYQDEGTDLATTENIAVNSKVYGLKNLAEGKTYYISDQFSDESDYFQSHVDTTKWDKVYTNFPQGPSSLIGERFPGFTLAKDGTPGLVSPNLGQPITARLVSKWKTLGSFTASVVATYDSRGSTSNTLGSTIGIIDSTGRRIFIQKARANFFQASTQFYSIVYSVHDTSPSTTYASKTYLCGNSNFLCFAIVPGTLDDLSEYVLQVSRVKSIDIDLLRFSYVDTVNGIGAFEFDSDPYFEIDLTQLSTPLVGDIKVFIQNHWTRQSSSALFTPGPEGSFVRINRFAFGGESTFSRTIEFDSSGVVGTSGITLVDNRHVSAASLTVDKYLAVDLGRRYFLDIVTNYTKIGNQLWNPYYLQYSNSDTEVPEEVVWGNSTSQDARWLLFSEKAVPSTQTSGLKYVDHLRVYPDITVRPPTELTNSEWQELDRQLTDGSNQTKIAQTDYPVLCVDLNNQFEMSSLQLLSNFGLEYRRDGQSTEYSTWGDLGDLSFSSSLTEDPSLIVDWAPWVEYSDENKPTSPQKWLAFRNKTFSVSGVGIKYYAAELVVTTPGVSSGSAGQVNDRVDFTEYPQWYLVDFSTEQDLAYVSENEEAFDGLLYGTSSSGLYLQEPLSPLYNLFDDNPETVFHLAGTSPAAWRVFGVPTAVSSSGTGDLEVSGTGGSFTLSGSNTLTETIAYSGVLVDGFELAVSPGSPGIPDVVSFQTLTGTDPNSNASWQTYYTESGLVTSTLVAGQEELEFNGGRDLKVFFDPPVTVTGGRIVLNNISYLSNQDQLVELSGFKIFKINTFENSNLVQVTKDASRRFEGSGSLKITLSSGISSPVKVTTGGNFNLNPDPKWSLQDYFSLYFGSDNLQLLDLANSFIKLGKDSTAFYKWSLTQVYDQLPAPEGLELLKLKFLSANDRALGELDLLRPELANFESKVNFQTGPLEFFELELVPSGTLTSEVTVWLDRPHILRENFTLSGINPTLYLNNSELVYFPTTNLNLKQGFIEFTLTPDWDRNSQLTPEREQAFTLFTMCNSADESFSLYYDSRKGLVLSFYNSSDKLNLDFGDLLSLEKYKPIKLALSWDSSGQSVSDIPGATAVLWVNDRLAGYFKDTWEIAQTKDVYLFLGSRASSSSVAINTTLNYETNSPIKIVPDTRSVTGGLEDLILCNTPQRVSYSSLQTLRDKIYLSIDGVNYYSGTDPALPFLLYNIAPGDSVQVWVKTNLPEDTTNMQRTGFLRARWRIVE